MSATEPLYFFLSESIAETVEYCGLQFIRFGLLQHLATVDSHLTLHHFARFENLLYTLLGKFMKK